MRQNTRLICGSAFLFFAILLFIEGGELPLALVFAVAALAFLYRELVAGVALIVPIVCKLGTLLRKRAEKVEKHKHCACCGATPVYMVTTCASRTCTNTPPEVLILFVCREHHPNPKIGTEAHELSALLTKIHPDITVERIYPHNPYSY